MTGWRRFYDRIRARVRVLRRPPPPPEPRQYRPRPEPRGPGWLHSRARESAVYRRLFPRKPPRW